MNDTYDGQGQTILERVMQYAGKTRRDVSNPCITARDAIALADLLAEKQALLEAAQKDAARYQWLRDNCTRAGVIVDVGAGAEIFNTIDDAIDDAMASQP